jgi:hypothetical protein
VVVSESERDYCGGGTILATWWKIKVTPRLGKQAGWLFSFLTIFDPAMELPLIYATNNPTISAWADHGSAKSTLKTTNFLFL